MSDEKREWDRAFERKTVPSEWHFYNQDRKTECDFGGICWTPFRMFHFSFFILVFSISVKREKTHKISMITDLYIPYDLRSKINRTKSTHTHARTVASQLKQNCNLIRILIYFSLLSSRCHEKMIYFFSIRIWLLSICGHKKRNEKMRWCLVLLPRQQRPSIDTTTFRVVESGFVFISLHFAHTQHIL